MLEYNAFVVDAFANPQYVWKSGSPNDDLLQSQAGERTRGVWFKLIVDPETRRLYYKVYGSPYAIAAVELLAREVSNGHLQLGTDLDLENMRKTLDMPFPYMHILLTLEDAWTLLVP